MSKIMVKFSQKYDFVLLDPEQGLLRRKGKGQGSPIEVNNTPFVQAKIKEGLLTEVSRRSKDK
jgi:hypothetical protein